MGRELRRKQAKREGKSLKRETIEEKNQIVSLVKITSLLIVIVLLIYLIFVLFVTKELDWFSKKENDINYITNSILASSIFKQSDEEYYVYFYDFKDETDTIKSAIENKLSGSKVYRVDTSSDLNSRYVSETSNKNAKRLEDLQVKKDTVIKIVGDSIVKYYEGDEILTIN